MMRVSMVVAAGALAIGCTSVSPDAGEEAVLVRKPMFFGHGGVDDTPIKTGRSYVAWTTDYVTVNMQPQRVDMEFDDLMTASGVPIDFHAVFSYQITDSVSLVRNFGADYLDRQGPGWFIRNLDQPAPRCGMRSRSRRCRPSPSRRARRKGWTPRSPSISRR